MEIPIVGQGRKRTASYAGLHAGPQTFFKYQKTNEDQSANIAIIVEETAHQAAAQAAAALLEPQAHKLPAVSEVSHCRQLVDSYCRKLLDRLVTI